MLAMSLTDSYCTPKWLADRLGVFFTDPCSNPRSHILAANAFSLEQGIDGLVQPWYGRVFLNHPYSKPLPWMRKLRAEFELENCTEAVVLAKLDCSTKWWRELTAPMAEWTDLWMFNDRLQFEPPPGVETSSNNFCSVIVHHMNSATPALELSDIATLWRQV